MVSIDSINISPLRGLDMRNPWLNADGVKLLSNHYSASCVISEHNPLRFTHYGLRSWLSRSFTGIGYLSLPAGRIEVYRQRITDSQQKSKDFPIEMGICLWDTYIHQDNAVVGEIRDVFLGECL